MARKAASTLASKKPVLTLAQISAYDDILTDALIDHAFYWTIVPKNRPSYHPSRGTREAEISNIITHEIIVKNNLDSAERRLLETAGLRKFYNSLRTDAEKANFRAHMRRYMNLYCVDCPWEVNSTNRYTIISHEAAITARRFIRRNETIKYLSGIQVVMTPDEEREISVRKKDFSVVVSARSKCASLFMGPARFANHDCAANAKLMTTSQSGIEIVATRNIDIGEEITVTYSASYFGERNCDCLCKTCENNLRNGWAQTPAAASSTTELSGVKPSIEGGDPPADGYSLRRRRRRCDDGSATASRSSSVALAVTEDIRPKVSRGARHRAAANARASTGLGTGTSRSPEASADLNRPMLKRGLGQLETPPVTPAKKAKADEECEGEVGATQVVVANAPAVSLDMESKETEVIIAADDKPPEATTAADDKPPEATTATDEQPQEEPVINADADTAQEHDTIPRLLSPESLPESDAVVTSSSSSKQSKPPSVIQTPLSKSTNRRIPGDYTLTPLLLCEPEMAWIACTICSSFFVQQNAYYTKSSCPRCERHSKLYGFMWPKTQPEGPRDKEERVLDHRTVHRFLRASDELRARGRKIQSSPSRSCTGTSLEQKNEAENDAEGREVEAEAHD
ncbi:hypothetical protein BROUX41_006226 [Berkeleyomyces rouxiae]|uniref:uncharacterized protein n=1 Tax=Berkeleyomyces rouxiae TaxID=2035830 RepID=UPI003B814C28